MLLANKYLLIITLLILVSTQKTYAQECYHINLSKHFNIKLKVSRVSEADSFPLASTVLVYIIDQETNKEIQSIHIDAEYLFDDVFSNCTAVRSYVTGYNADADAMDNDYGDVVVANFNFDDREDLAVKYSSGGNGGPQYNYYIQTEQGGFKLNEFLTEQMIYFPTEIDAKRKRLINYVHANALGENMNVYAYNSAKRTWKFVKRRFRRG